MYPLLSSKFGPICYLADLSMNVSYFETLGNPSMIASKPTATAYTWIYSQLFSKFEVLWKLPAEVVHLLSRNGKSCKNTKTARIVYKFEVHQNPPKTHRFVLDIISSKYRLM